MTTSAFTSGSDISTDANFRAFGSAVNAALAAVGLVQTADTGQINWTTVTHPAATNTFQGYEIWRFSDTLQSTVPVFVRLDYGSSSANASQANIKISVGVATNGAGTLTGAGTFTGARVLVASQAFTTTPLNCYASSDGSYLTLALFVDNNSRCLWLLVDRTRNSDGTPNGDGVYVRGGGHGTNTNTFEQVISFYGVAVSNLLTATSVVTRLPSYWTSLVDGTDIYTTPIYVFAPRGQAPTSAALLHFTADIAQSTTFTTTHNGSSHTFIATGSGGSDGATAVCGIALRYE